MPGGYKDPDSIAAEIKMTRMVHEDAFLVVEGVNDVRFWRTRRHDTCELVDGEGKPNVVGAVHQLDTAGIRGILGIVDDDYDSLMGTSRTSLNLVATDAHDLECLLCRSLALDTVLAEFGIAWKIQEFEEATGVDVRSGLLDRTTVFGRLRWAARRHDLDIDCGAIHVPRFIDINTWTVDVDELARAVSNGGSPHDCDVLKRRIAEPTGADPWRVAHGHDMIEILRIGLMRVLGALPASKGTEDIARVLRAAISLEELQRTTLYADMRTWESANDYLVLPNGVVA